jgi:hypothetical protein
VRKDGKESEREIESSGEGERERGSVGGRENEFLGREKGKREERREGG